MEADLWKSPGEEGLGAPRDSPELLLGRVNLTRDPKSEMKMPLFCRSQQKFDKYKKHIKA